MVTVYYNWVVGPFALLVGHFALNTCKGLHHDHDWLLLLTWYHWLVLLLVLIDIWHILSWSHHEHLWLLGGRLHGCRVAGCLERRSSLCMLGQWRNLIDHSGLRLLWILRRQNRRHALFFLLYNRCACQQTACVAILVCWNLFVELFAGIYHDLQSLIFLVS